MRLRLPGSRDRTPHDDDRCEHSFWTLQDKMMLARQCRKAQALSTRALKQQRLASSETAAAAAANARRAGGAPEESDFSRYAGIAFFSTIVSVCAFRAAHLMDGERSFAFPPHFPAMLTESKWWRLMLSLLECEGCRNSVLGCVAGEARFHLGVWKQEGRGDDEKEVTGRVLCCRHNAITGKWI